ncbi:AAA family ATPase [Micromonospora sp. RL09-050-HVF-A]|uniref:AAA family ATPase n=1 Tax=Micromonospora sp. RL09-050-HVF-A TaxID=1703433 RepID=UPI001C5F9550|nr:AAA family ATPase [Micromonospora sp. RL09-050-HVF-A]MBW4705177.1 ATP-binding protein [Micromonospora sp. RL09-050-HVF-A]
MRFSLVDPGSRHQIATPGEALLVIDWWNDYHFVTQFQLIIFDRAGERHEIGHVKIGRFGLRTEEKMPELLARQFDSLGEGFFSLGQDDTYYEKLEHLGVRVEVLTALRDLAYDSGLLERAQSEQVTKTSLLRNIPLEVVRGQFRGIAHGGARITPYQFEYRPAVRPWDEISWSRGLDFAIVINRRPPTNVHVLIGRNNVGKSHLLRNLVRAVCDRRAREADVGSVVHRDQQGPSGFLGVVAVSFSVFDRFVAIPEADRLIPYTHVGAHEPIDKPDDTDTDSETAARPLQRDELAARFAESLEACLTGRAADRWTNAVSTLRYSGSGFLEDDTWMPRFRAADADSRREMAKKLFKGLSSGHAIVLLTITSLVEKVSERTLVLVDEPESHLHPPLLAAMMRALSDLLVDRNGVAVVATHSPVVLQEVPASCVWMIRRHDTVVTPERPAMETFGENVGTLTHEVFALEVTDSGYHRLIREAVRADLGYQGVLDHFHGQLGSEAKTIARTLIAIRDRGGEV